MFGKKKEEKPTRSPDIDSLIGENISIDGKIRGNGNIRIDGSVEGDIEYDGDVSLGESGRIKGNVACHNLTAAGSIDGNVMVKDAFTLLPTGSLIGDMEVKSLVIHEQATFDGSCKMLSTDNVKPLKTEKLDEEKQKVK